MIEYILHSDYQKLPQGYGTCKIGKPYYAMGCSAHLSGYRGFDFGGFEAGYFVQRLKLMARFTAARSH